MVPAEGSVLPSGEKVIEVTESAWPLRLARSVGYRCRVEEEDTSTVIHQMGSGIRARTGSPLRWKNGIPDSRYTPASECKIRVIILHSAGEILLR